MINRISIIVCMFVVLQSPYSDVNYQEQVETKEQGRRTGASPAAHLWHRHGGCSSDLPFIFNPSKLSFMLQPKSDGACADQISTPASDPVTTGQQYNYAPMSTREHELLNTLLLLSPPIVRLRVIFNHSNVVLIGNLKHNRRTVVAKRPTFSLACESLFSEIEKKKSLPSNRTKKQC